jgi:hypothetical protein
MGLKLLGSAPSGTVDASTKAYADTKATKWIANFFGRDQGRDPLLFERFNDKADGTPPLLFDSGQVADWTLTPAVAPAVSGGVLGSSAVGASYYRSAALGATCTEIGGRFTITPGSATRTTAGSAVLGIGTGPVVTSGGVVINMSCHALFYKEGWSYGIWESGAYVALAGDTYLVALPDDGVTEYEACVQINGTTATIFSPDGNVTSVTDARIGTYAGQYPFFETFRPAATDDHDRWASIWANTGTPKRRALLPLTLFGQQIVKGFKAFLAGIYASAITFPTGAAAGKFVISTDGGGTLGYGTPPCDFVMVAQSGVRATGIGDLAVAQYVGRAFTLTKVVYQFDSADASGSTTVETRRNGSQVSSSSIAVTAANQVDGTSTEAARTVTINQSFAVGDRITPWITGVGTTPGRGLRAYYFGTWN